MFKSLKVPWLGKRDSVDDDSNFDAKHEQPPVSQREPLGLHVVYHPQEQPSVDIIFVHGLGGTSRLSWSWNKDLSLFWPQEWLPLEPGLQGARILTFGYNASFMSRSKDNFDISDFAKELVFEMKFANDENGNSLHIGQRPVMFVVHSLGGLVVKKACIIGAQSLQYQSIFEAVNSIMFLGTPHRGSSSSNLAVIMRSLSPKSNIGQIQQHDATMNDINDRFRLYADKIEVVSFFETQPTWIGIKRSLVVDKHSATMAVPKEISSMLNADHRNMTKFQSQQDPNYRTVLNMIKSLVQKSTVEGSSKHQSLFQSREVEARFLETHLIEPSSPIGVVNLASVDAPFSVHGNEDTTVSHSASRPSGGTRQTYASSAGYQGVMTDPTLYSCDKSECEDAQPDECEGIQIQPEEHQQLQGLYTMKTEYSVTNGPRNERYITDLAAELFEAAKAFHADMNTLERLSERLPDLLRAFAVKIGHQALTQTDLDIAYFIQKHRGEIQSSFQVESLSLQGSKKAGDSRNGEFSIGRFLDDETTEFDRLPENEQPEDELADVPEGSRPDFEETRLELDAGKYLDYIIKSPAYTWLIGTFQRESTLKRATPVDVMSRIRADILAALPASRSVSRSAPSQRYKATFELFWDPLAFVEVQEYTEAAEVALRRAITITGSADDAQAATTRDYLVQTWPNGGKIMQLIEDVTRCGRKTPVSCILSDKTELEVWIDDGKFMALATGPGDSIVEVGQQLAWLGAALQSSTSTTGIAPCTPFVSSATLKPTDTLSSESEQLPEILCVIDFDIQLPVIDNAERPGHCWHKMFRKPVMVVGYPILSKPASNSGLGLEVPLKMMSILAGSDRVHEFEDRILIKGFSTMIGATKRMGDLIVWHYLYNADGGKLSHLDLMLHHEFNGSLSLSELESARHVVGWCSECKFYAGTLNASEDLERAEGLSPPSSGCRLDRISLSGGKIISAGASIALGVKDPPEHLTIKGYIPKLKSIDKKYVVLWDQADKRGWLVNGTSALLHLVRASLHYSSQDKFSSALLWKQSNMEERGSVIDVLVNEGNRELAVYADKPTVCDEDEVKREGDSKKESTAKKVKWDYFTFQDLVEQYYHYLDQIIDYEARSEARNGFDLKANFRARLEGWDFVELATNSSTQLMKPEVFKGMCPKWETLPKGKCYLAVSGMDLKRSISNSKRLLWHSPAKPVDSCGCQGPSGSRLRSHFGGHHDPVQVFWPKHSRHILPTTRSNTIHTRGAYVFGHNVTWPYNWKAGKKEDEDDLERISTGDSSDSGLRDDLAWASMDQSTHSIVSGTAAMTLSPLPSDIFTTRSSEPPSTPLTGPSHLDSKQSLSYRLPSMHSQPPDPSFESETGYGDDAHRQARRLKRQSLK